jgi:hypothetical protein
MVTPGRFELPTYGLGNRRSIQLSYGAMFEINYLQSMRDSFAHFASPEILAPLRSRETVERKASTPYQQVSIKTVPRSKGDSRLRRKGRWNAEEQVLLLQRLNSPADASGLPAIHSLCFPHPAANRFSCCVI